MLASSGPFQTMVQGRDQTVAVSVTLTLPPAAAAYQDVSLALTAWEVDASIDSDMPQGTRLEEGFSAVGGSFTVSGRVDPTDETKSAAWLFARYPVPAADGSISPLYHSDVLLAAVTMSIGLYPAGSAGVPELLTKLVGKIEDYTRDADGNVQFTVIDLRQSFRGSVDIPGVVTPAPFNSGMTSEFAIDRLLRSSSAAAISSWPAPRAGCVLAVGFRTSPYAEIGNLETDLSSGAFVFTPGLYGSAVSGGSLGAVLFYLLAAPMTGADFYTEFVLTAASTPSPDDFRINVGGNPVNGWVLDLTLVSGFTQPRVTLYHTDGTSTGSFTFPVAFGSGTLKCALQVHWPTGSTAWSATFTVNGTSYASGAQTTSHARAAAGLPQPTAANLRIGNPGIVAAVQTAGIEAWQVTAEGIGTVPSWGTFIPGAVLDPSKNTLIAIPEITGDPWQAIQQMAQAELAVAAFEGSGFRYLNRQTLRQSASVRDITSDQALNALSEQSTSASVVNRAQVGYTPWAFGAVKSTVWSADTVIKVPKHGSWTSTITLESALYLDPRDDLTVIWLPDGSTDTTASYLRASLDPAGAAQFPPTEPLTITLTQSSPTTVTITADNQSSRNAYLVSSAVYTDLPVGTPLLRVAGLAVTQQPEQTADYQYPPTTVVGSNGQTGAAGSRFGEVLYQLTGNPWIQDSDTAAELAQDIVIDSYLPRVDLLGVDIAPDPRLQRCDRVRLLDTARTFVDEYALIFGYTITYTAPSEPAGQAQFSMTLDARTIAMPGGWVGGVAGRSEGGVTTFGYGS